MLMLVACQGDPTQRSSQAPNTYDPAADPAVNPPSLFETLSDENRHRADTEATLVRYALDLPTSMNAMFNRAWADGYLHELLFDPLVHRNADMQAVWNENLVKSVEELEGGLVHRVHLYPFLKWHDGVPFTSHDVRFSYLMAKDPGVPALDAKHKVEEIDDIRVIDDHTFEVVHQRLSAVRLDNLYFWTVPKHLLDNPEERAKDPTMMTSEFFNRFKREVGVGNGPYRFVEWIPGDRVVVERWEDYPFQKPPIKRQVITSQPDRNTALLQFRQGHLDDIWFTVQQHGSQTNDAEFLDIGVKAWKPRWMQAYVGWDQSGKTPFFTDRRVRQAMAHAYDRETVLRTVTWNLYRPSNGMFGPTHWCHNPEVVPLEYDLEKAAALLDEAGWVTDPDDGWRYKDIDGQRVQFHFVLNLPQSFVDARRFADIFRADLRRIGVSFDTEIHENAIRTKKMTEHEYTAHVDTYQVFADPDIWRNFLHTYAIDNGRNYDSYSSPKVDELFDVSQMELDRAKRAEHFREIHRLVYDDQPVLWMWNYTTTWGFSKRVRGVQTSPSGVTNFLPGTRAWWIEKPGAPTPAPTATGSGD
ncbi:MAG: ABC transporter substrate-binding protein [Acidobacteriota bacterium]|nr:ABC transporter substrate-binding protein [Acidobacteriota bacterium]